MLTVEPLASGGGNCLEIRLARRDRAVLHLYHIHQLGQVGQGVRVGGVRRPLEARWGGLGLLLSSSPHAALLTWFGGGAE